MDMDSFPRYSELSLLFCNANVLGGCGDGDNNGAPSAESHPFLMGSTHMPSELYDALKDCSGITASYVRYDCPHILCGGFNTSSNCGGDDAINWLLNNGW
jgi:hypothetical protein